MLDEEVETVHFPTLDVELTVLPGVDVETTLSDPHHRY